MSASLIVLIPLVLVALVGTLCFVGCGFQTAGIPYDGGNYETPLFNTLGLVALWPLNDQTFGNTNIPQAAADRAPKPGNAKGFDGQYQGTLNTSFLLNQPSIVPGESSNVGPACVLFKGTDGFVSVPFHQQLNPGSFTVEAWVQPKWSANDIAQRAVVVSATIGGVGFGLFARPDNFWEVQLGMGGGNFFPVTSTDMIPLNPPVTQYLAVTYDSTTLKLMLYVGSVGGTLKPFSGTLTSPFVAEDSTATPSTATPLFIGMGRPDMPGGMNPFNGFIQDVAVYNFAIDGTILQGHLNLGSTPPADT